jgi:hypothetical protein
MRTIKFQMDGNHVCATWDDFDCLATSPAGFGDTIAAAALDLFLNDPIVAKSAPKE